jgi:hypothetical protein
MSPTLGRTAALTGARYLGDFAMAYNVKRYQDGQTIGSASITNEQFAHYMAMSQQPEGIIRLGALPHDYYDLDADYQDMSADTTVYLD